MSTALLTWATHGTWLRGPARGWIERDAPLPAPAPGPPIELPEPDELLSVRRARSLRWPRVRLGPDARRVVMDDLPRIARLRGFILLVTVVAEDHVHLLLETDPDRSVPRLVQLVKGSLSRALSVAAGDAEATTAGGERLPHHKWWTRQHSFRWVREAEVGSVRRQLEMHRSPGVEVRVNP